MHINVDECGKSNNMTVPNMIIIEWWKKPAPNGRFTIGFAALCMLNKMMITYDNYAVQAMHFGVQWINDISSPSRWKDDQDHRQIDDIATEVPQGTQMNQMNESKDLNKAF